MTPDLTAFPYSTYGSYFSLFRETDDGPLIVRLIRAHLGREKMFELTFERAGEAIAFDVDARPECVLVRGRDGGSARIVLVGSDVLALAADGLDVRVRMHEAQAGYGYRESPTCFKLMSSVTGLFAKLDVVTGEPTAQLPVSDVDWFGRPPTEVVVACDGGRADLRLRASRWDLLPGADDLDFDAAEAVVRADWEAFAAGMPAFPAARRECGERAWFNLWSCFLRAEGNYRTDACLMSKSGMGAIWSWDHCFNAMALVGGHPRLAFDQWMFPFHLQAPTGQLPDRVTPTDLTWLWVKPPIHGWALDRLLDAHEPDAAWLASAHVALERWTQWWVDYRDADADGIPNYIFGCDVADNATIFTDTSFLIESPDLAAGLALQMRTVARLARMVGDEAGALRWEEAGAVLVGRLEDQLWEDGRFVAKISGTHEIETSDDVADAVPRSHAGRADGRRKVCADGGLARGRAFVGTRFGVRGAGESALRAGRLLARPDLGTGGVHDCGRTAARRARAIWRGPSPSDSARRSSGGRNSRRTTTRRRARGCGRRATRGPRACICCWFRIIFRNDGTTDHLRTRSALAGRDGRRVPTRRRSRFPGRRRRSSSRPSCRTP